MDFLVGIPLWLLFVIAVIAIIVLWKLIKFAIKVFIAIILFFAVLIGLDLLGVFGWIQENVFTMLLSIFVL